MIKKETIAQIILDFQKQDLPDVIKRELQIKLEIPIKRAITIVGPRRSGKTYYLYSLINKLLQKAVPKERILYINFESPKLVSASIEDLSLILEVFYEIYPRNKDKKVWLFFDEIQNIENWETFIRSVLDNEKAQVFLSGSSAKFLAKEIATSLRGRTLTYLLLPFSFSEFLICKSFTYQKYLSSAEKSSILNAFSEYFSFGGYPEAVIYPEEHEKIINEIIEVTIYRDLIERHKLRNVKVIKLMFNYLIKAKEFSVHKFFNFLKSLNIKISKNSLYNYLEFFNDAFIFFPLKRFSYSLKNIEQSIAKIYTIDNSFIANITGNDQSKKFENLVFLSFVRKGYEANKDIFYYSDSTGEVDFLIKKKNKVIFLIQACFDMSDYSTKEREIKSLLKASKELQCNNLLVITSDYEAHLPAEAFAKAQEKVKACLPKRQDKKIKFIPLWKWLLSCG